MDKHHWKHGLLPLNLRRFGAGADPAAGEAGDDDVEDQPDDWPEEEGGRPAGKTFTQAELTATAAREAKRERRKLLRVLGVDASLEGDALRDALAKLKPTAGTRQPTAHTVRDNPAPAEDDRVALAEAKALRLERKLLAIAQGVPSDKADRYLKLAESYLDDPDDDFGDALAAAIADFPIANPAKKGSASVGANPGQSAGGKAVLNPGQEAAQRHREQLKRSQEAQKRFVHQ